jgi:ribonuclease VapC
MIVDSSAMIAAIKRESDWIALSQAINSAETLRMSAASYLETAIVVDGLRDAVQSARLDELLLDLEMIIEPVTATQARIARQAYRDYGKGSGHAAGLNFGDCFSYALAREKREPLLFKGGDFTHTDIRQA